MDLTATNSRGSDRTGNPAARHGFFRNSFGHLRAGWRISIFLLLIIPAMLPTIAIVRIVGAIFPSWRGGGVGSPIDIVFMWSIALTLTLAAFGTLRWVDRRPYDLLGMPFSRSALREFLVGSSVGVANLVVVAATLYVIGALDIAWRGIDATAMRVLGYYAVVFFGGAAIEETVNRGYIFQALCEGTRTWFAVLLTSVVFSLVHLFNPHMTFASVLFLCIHGVLYAAVYLKTRSLWAAIGVHWAWNLMQGAVLGSHVSGTVVANGILTARPQGVEFLSGGQFGVEGSLLTSIISLGVVAFVWKSGYLTASAKMTALWDRYPRGYRLDPASPSR